MHQASHPHLQTGWSTLEFVILTPAIAMTIGALMAIAQVSFAKLHLTSVIDAGVRVGAVRGCDEAKSMVRQSVSNTDNIVTLECSEEKDVSLRLAYRVKSSIPYLDLFQYTLELRSHAISEKREK